MPEIDTRHAPKGELAARALVEQVMASDDRVERHYLEVKSTLDLETKRDQAKLAKFILGAANRMPDLAAAAFEGHGVIVVGASKGQMSGVPPIEALEIQKAVLPFIGADGPRYDLVRVPCEQTDNEVLVIIVDPPRWGQEPFVCRKSGDGQLRDGAVFVRADGETREARADELMQLMQRGRAGETKVAFDLRVVGVVRPIAVDNERTVEEFIARHRHSLSAALHRSKTSTGSWAAGRVVGIMQDMTEPESRGEDEYLASVDKWEESVRRAWPNAVLLLIGARTEPVEIEITNREKTFLHDVEVKVHLGGPVRGVNHWSPRDELRYEDLEIPVPPRAWGPRTANWIGLGASLGISPHLLSQSISMPSFSRTQWTNSGSVDWSFTVGELRPRQVDTSDDAEFVLYTLDPSMPAVRGTWEITARDHHDVYSGNVDVEIGDPLDLTADLRIILGLEEAD